MHSGSLDPTAWSGFLRNVELPEARKHRWVLCIDGRSGELLRKDGEKGPFSNHRFLDSFSV